MEKRNGEKIGWVGGWLGVFYIFACAPWKTPKTPYWKLMIRIYAVFLTAVAWAIWSYNGWKATGLNWWNLFLLLPLLTPLFILSRRTWNNILSGPDDGEPEK